MPRVAVDEEQIEAVAHAEPVQARVDERERLLELGRVVDVEHSAAFCVGERPHAVLRRESRECCRRLAAPSQDHERDPLWKGDEHACAFALGRADEPDRAGRESGGFESGAQNLVDKDGHGPQCGAAGPEHRGVEALEQLAGDVERDVRSRLEVRSDRPDRDAPLAHAKPVRERPRAGFALERRELRHDRDLAHEIVHAVVVEAQPVERPFVEAAGRGLVVGRIRSEDLVAPFADQSGCNRERVGDGVVAKGRKRRVRGGRLGLDLLSERGHFTLYTARRQRGSPRSASREAEGPAL